MFRVICDGEVIHTVEEQVMEVKIRTAHGEGAPTFISDDGVVELVISRVAAAGPMRLDQLDAAKDQALRDRAVDGAKVGHNRNAHGDAKLLLTRQGVITDTLGDDVGRNEAPDFGSLPSRDLSVGFDKDDHEGRTKAIEDFGRDSGNNRLDSLTDNAKDDSNEDSKLSLT